MTTFDADLASRGWALISEGAQMISLAYAAIDPAAVARTAAVPGAEGARAVVPPASSAPAAPSLKPQVDAGLGLCPVHGVPWTVKEGGISSKTKKRYSSFWHCDVRDEDGFCDERPQPIWRDAHPAEVAA